MMLHALVDGHLGALGVVVGHALEELARIPCHVEVGMHVHHREIDELVRGQRGGVLARLACLDARHERLQISIAGLVDLLELLAPERVRRVVLVHDAEEIEDAPVDVRDSILVGVGNPANRILIGDELEFVVDGLGLGIHGWKHILGGGGVV